MKILLAKCLMPMVIWKKIFHFVSLSLLLLEYINILNDVSYFTKFFDEHCKKKQ